MNSIKLAFVLSILFIANVIQASEEAQCIISQLSNDLAKGIESGDDLNPSLVESIQQHLPEFSNFVNSYPYKNFKHT